MRQNIWKLVLKKFAKYYDISTGFCAAKYWTNKIEENVFQLIQAIHSELFDTYDFDFEGNYDKLIKKIGHMSLFLFYLHFLWCRRSCEKKSGYCKVCLGVRKNIFYEYNTFLSLNVAYTDDYLNVSSSERIYLDVFLNKPAYFPYCFTESAGICSDFEVFPFARDLFAAFCSVLVRMHLNITTEHFSDLISQLSLYDEKKSRQRDFYVCTSIIA